MFDVNDDAKGGYRRIEVLTGPGRRRRWSVDEKARIVSETLVPGARVSAVARRWQVCPQQVFGWRRAMREDVSVAAIDTMNAVVPDFVPLVSASGLSKIPGQPSPSSAIEVELSGAVMRIESGMDDAMLTAVLRAIRGVLSSAAQGEPAFLDQPADIPARSIGNADYADRILRRQGAYQAGRQGG